MKTLIHNSLTPSLLLGLAAIAATPTRAAVTPEYERHFRSPSKYENSAPAAVAPAPAAPAPAAPTRPAAAPMDNALPPQNAKPGECYTRVLVAPQIDTVSDRVVRREEGFELIEVPAVLETVDERVMVRGAGERQEVIPATYKEVEERILKSPAYTRQIPVAAKYETRSERVLVKPERSYWKKGTGSLQKVDGEAGEIMCYVTDPAVYDTVSRNVLVSAATFREEQVPAVYDTVKRTVVDQPAQIKKIEIPAEYSTVKVQKIKTPARVDKKVVPAEYGSVERQVVRGQSHMEWRRILCETNTTPEIIGDIQTALNTRGFNVGAVDGVYGKSTDKAVAAFQAANNLPQGGLTYETLAALGVSK